MKYPIPQSLHSALRSVGLGLSLGSGLFLSQAAHAESEKEAIQQFLSDYYDSLSRDPIEAAAFYGEPAIIVLPTDVLPLNKRADVEAFLTKLLSGFKPLGFSYAKLSDPRIKMLSETTAIYSTVAIRYKTDGSEMPRGGFTYLLHKGPSGWKIHELISATECHEDDLASFPTFEACDDQAVKYLANQDLYDDQGGKLADVLCRWVDK
jgi:ketosteroid isomerase-like protein